jgi:hypothetical protein
LAAQMLSLSPIAVSAVRLGDDFDADYACIGGDVDNGGFGDVYYDDECCWR